MSRTARTFGGARGAGLPAPHRRCRPRPIPRPGCPIGVVTD